MSEVEKERMLQREVLQALITRELEAWVNKLCRELGDILKASGIAKAKGIELNKAPASVPVKDAKRLILSLVPEAVKIIAIKHVGEALKDPKSAAGYLSMVTNNT
jgi:hypothetical protein